MGIKPGIKIDENEIFGSGWGWGWVWGWEDWRVRWLLVFVDVDIDIWGWIVAIIGVVGWLWLDGCEVVGCGWMAVRWGGGEMGEG